MRKGLYSEPDAEVLCKVVRNLKPIRILEVGCREGRTTDCILSSLREKSVCPLNILLEILHIRAHSGIPHSSTSGVTL